MVKNYKFVCTFSNQEQLEKDLDYIRRHVVVKFNKIVVLQNIQEPNKLYFIYQIPIEQTKDLYKIKDTILVHRKKQTNTIFTINSLNQLIKQNNDGILDKEYLISWVDYKNMIILLDKNNNINKMEIKLNQVFRY